MAKKPEAIFSSIWGGFFVTYSKQAKALGVFDAIKYNFIGVGEAVTPETTKSMGADYPVGIWGNSYDAFYWGETPGHRDYTARLSKYLKDEYPSSWAIQGYIGMQFLTEAIKKAASADSDKVAKALLGLTVDTPVGPLTIREKDHQANRGQLYGKTAKDPKYPFSIMKPVTYVDPTKFTDWSSPASGMPASPPRFHARSRLPLGPLPADPAGRHPARAERLVHALRRHHPLLQPVHHPAGPRHRAGLLAHPAAHARRALHPRRRAGPRDPGRARRQRRRALYLGVRAGLVPGRP